ncbi:unnamed protein product, partial [Polarella glacialis]
MRGQHFGRRRKKDGEAVVSGGEEPICYRCGYPWADHPSDLGPYQKWCLRRWAAGAVVCFTDADSGEPFFLFGEERRLDGGYNVFWGFGELFETNPRETAARESFEEALGLLGSSEQLREHLAEQDSLDPGNLPLFLLHLGARKAQSLLDEYGRRRELWKFATEGLRPLAQPGGRPPGGDVMDALLAVPAGAFLQAAQESGAAPAGMFEVALGRQRSGISMP